LRVSESGVFASGFFFSVLTEIIFWERLFSIAVLYGENSSGGTNEKGKFGYFGCAILRRIGFCEWGQAATAEFFRFWQRTGFKRSLPHRGGNRYCLPI
jgi:hypothetical protein